MKWLVLIAAFGLAAPLSGCNKSKKDAVPAEVDVEWPDAAGFPPDGDSKKPERKPDQPDPDEAAPAPAPGSPMSPSMSSGSDDG